MSVQMIGKYQLQRELGRGSMGIVYEAIDSETGKKAAIKILVVSGTVDATGRKQMVERFQREARAASQLIHPNIAQIYETGEYNGRYYIAMELCTGTSMRNFLRFEKKMTAEKTKNMAMQLLSALAVAHESGVFHRDIKPDNIVFGTDAKLKLMDFGIAKIESEGTMTQTGQVMGSPAYMSPEQVQGIAVDARSDLFSVGVVLYEALTGEKPFPGDTITAITHSIVYDEPVPAMGISESWNAIIRKALQKDPAKRYQNANEMMNDISMGKVPYVAQSPAPQTQSPAYSAPGQGLGNATMYAPGPGQAPPAPWQQPVQPGYMNPQQPVGPPSGAYYGNTPGTRYDPDLINMRIHSPASPWRRWAAAVIDNLILTVIFVILAVAGVINMHDEYGINLFTNIFSWIAIMVSGAYFIIMNALLGQTVGKMAMGIRIEKYDSTEFSWSSAFIRYAVQYLLSAVTGGLIYILVLTDMENRGLHDKIANTIVVDA